MMAELEVGVCRLVIVGSVTAVTKLVFFVFFLMIRRPPRSTQSRSSAASDVYKRQQIRLSPLPIKPEVILLRKMDIVFMS